VEADLFGYKTSWLAVRGEPDAVIEALELHDTRKLSWTEGLRVVHILAHPQPQIRVLVSPQILGWTFVVGWALPQIDVHPHENKRKFEAFTSFIVALGNRFDDVQFFASHRVVDYHAWARVTGGTIVRVFSYVGESGEVLTNIGVQTEEERVLGLADLEELSAEEATERLFASAENGGELPNEESVVQIARAWSVDPTDLDTMGLPESSVILGSLPAKFVAR
jgi:hypothetical protein